MSFIRFLREGVSDVDQINKKRLIDRTPRDQAFLNAMKASKPKAGKVAVTLLYSDGSKTKDVFKLIKPSDRWDKEAQETADGHLANMQKMHARFDPDKPGPVSVLKIEIK